MRTSLTAKHLTGVYRHVQFPTGPVPATLENQRHFVRVKCSQQDDEEMGKLCLEWETKSFEDAFHTLKASEYELQKAIVDSVLISNFNEADKLKMQLHTIAPGCSDEVRSLLEKGRGKFIGQCFFHKKNGYRGVIFKPDARCRMDESWVQMMGVRCLERGPDQPFYHCLVDVRDRPGAQTTYVAEDNVTLSNEAFTIQHPLIHSLFTEVPELKCYVGTDSLDFILSEYDD